MKTNMYKYMMNNENKSFILKITIAHEFMDVFFSLYFCVKVRGLTV